MELESDYRRRLELPEQSMRDGGLECASSVKHQKDVGYGMKTGWEDGLMPAWQWKPGGR